MQSEYGNFSNGPRNISWFKKKNVFTPRVNISIAMSLRHTHLLNAMAGRCRYLRRLPKIPVLVLIAKKGHWAYLLFRAIVVSR